MATDRLLTTREIQALLHVDRVTVYKLVKERDLPARRVGGQWRFSEVAVQDWLAGQDAPRASAEPVLLPPDLAQLVPLDTLQSIQTQLAHLLGVASCTLDRSGDMVASCSYCSRFCQLVHSTAAGLEGCRESRRSIALTAGEGGSIYRCHAGIHYACAPIIVAGERAGMITAGQFFTEPPDMQAFTARALETGRRIGVDGYALAAASASLEVVSRERVLSITSLLGTIANSLSAIGYQSYLLRHKLARIAELTASASESDRALS